MDAQMQIMQRSHLLYFKKFIQEHMNELRQSRIFIFGAGVRGCSLLWLLRHFQLPDIYFVDNNVNKQGSKIEDCTVLSFAEADRYEGKCIFLCPVEKGRSILTQLNDSGRKENIDYFNLDFFLTDYLDMIEDLKTPASDYSLLFGCCVASSYVLEREEVLSSLGEVIRDQVFQGKCRLCTLPGLYPVIYYHAINVCLQLQKNQPTFILMMIEMSSLSPYAPLMMGTQNYEQHKQFLEQLLALTPEDQEIQDYLQKVEARLERSKKGADPTSAENTLEAQRKVYKLKYMYRLREDDESVVFMKKILTRMAERKIPVILLFTPIDYQRGNLLCGEIFSQKYASTITALRSFLDGMSCNYVDASFIAASDFFVPPPVTSPDSNPFLNAKGQKLLLKFLKCLPTVKQFL